MAANIRRNIETSKHFGGLFTKKGGDIAAATAIYVGYFSLFGTTCHPNEIIMSK